MKHTWHIDGSLPTRGSRWPDRPQEKLLDVQPRGSTTSAASAQACSTRARERRQSAARCSVLADMCLGPPSSPYSMVNHHVPLRKAISVGSTRTHSLFNASSGPLVSGAGHLRRPEASQSSTRA